MSAANCRIRVSLEARRGVFVFRAACQWAGVPALPSGCSCSSVWKDTLCPTPVSFSPSACRCISSAYLRPLPPGPHLSKGSQLTSIKQRRPILGNYSLRRNPIRIVPHKHIGEVCPVVDSFFRCLSSFKAWQRLENRLKLGLVKVGKSKALTCVEPDFVRR